MIKAKKGEMLMNQEQLETVEVFLQYLVGKEEIKEVKEWYDPFLTKEEYESMV